MSRSTAWILALAIFAGGGEAADSAPVFETTESVAATASADASLPAPVTFDVVTAGNYTITLTDLRAPQELSSLRAIVSRDLAVVAELEVDYAATPTPPLPATQTFAATPGRYRVNVVGTAADGEVGSFGISVAPATGGNTLIDHVDTISAPAAASDGLSGLQANFSISQAGAYRLLLTDLAFPAALASTQVHVLQETPSGPPVDVPVVQDSFTATAGTYQLLVVAQAGQPSLAGLYNVRIDTGDGTPVVYQTTQAVGNLPPATVVNVAVAGQHTLTLTDLNFPAPLAAIQAVVTQNGAVLGTLNAAGAASFALGQGTTQVYAQATPTETDDVGAFGVQLARGAQSLYTDVRLADLSEDVATPAIYAVKTSAAVAAGAHDIKIQDFDFPLAFASLKTAVTQGAALVGTLNGAGTAQFTLQPSVVKVLIAVRPPAGGSHNALFGLTITQSGAAAPLLETTQGVGGLFRTHVVTIAAGGAYDVSLRDLEFPALMPVAALAITRRTELLAQIYGGGIVERQQLPAGTYVLNFLGVPANNAAAGTYGIQVAESAPQPTVTLTAKPATIVSGAQATLEWTANNATTCTASGGWSGAKNTTGSEPVGPLNTNGTYTLACNGPGGTGTATATITVTAPKANKGGGGAIDWQLLAVLGLLAAAGGFRTRRLQAHPG